ncbi:hypothetical protein BHM03_00020950 [Ensete ventricosum]|nr:hypothetical protein BHM03_00020950 [Ensete ventricosum]
MVEAANPSPRVVSHRTGNPRLVVVAGVSLGGASPTGSKVAEALEAMKSCHNSDSTLTARQLAKIQELEAGLSPTSRGMSHLSLYFFGFGDMTSPFCVVEMFNLARMKSANGVASGAAPPSTADVPPAPTVEHPPLTTKKRPRAHGGVCVGT